MGIFSGFLGGLLGIGGGVVVVPALVILFDWFDLLPARIGTLTAVATSLGCVICTSASAARAQILANRVDWTIARRWGPFLVVGSLLAGYVANLLPVTGLRGLIGAFLAFVAVVMLTSWKPQPQRPLPGLAGTTVAGTAGGLISGIAGIGGGNVIVPSLIYFNTPVHKATATSSALGVPIATAGLLGYAWVASQAPSVTSAVAGLWGFFYWPAFLAIAIPAIFTAPLGVRAAHKIDPLPLRRLFGLLLVCVSARMLYSAWEIVRI